MSTARQRALRYTRWIERHALAVILTGTLVLAASIALVVTRLPVHADLSYLLPQDAPAVRDLRRLEHRMIAKDAMLIVVRSSDPATRARVAASMAAAARALPSDLVAEVEDDDAETRAFLRAHASLLVPAADLEAARAALDAAVTRATLDATPGYIDFDDDDDSAKVAAADRAKLDDLVARRKDAMARLDHSGHVSADGTLQVVVVRAAFAKTDAAAGERLLNALDRARVAALAHAGGGAEIGFAGGAATNVAEHHGLVRGMLWSSVITGLLVAFVLWLYLRRLRLLAALGATLTIGTVACFGIAALTVGHLNAATAFLGAIIAGNGVNYGILVLARYLDERRRAPALEAMAVALADRLRPTLVASLGASIAYGCLAATSFRGFSDFAVIGAVGMALCWLATFTVLPALVLRFAPDATARERRFGLGAALARVLGFRRAAWVCAVVMLLAAGAGVVSWRFVSNDPFEYDARKLQSAGHEAREVARWRGISNDAFGKGFGGTGQVFIAADREPQVAQIVAALGKVDAGLPAERHRIGDVRSILDVIPADQEARLATLRQIDELLARAPLDDLDPALQATIAELRPPSDLRALTPADLPPSIADRLREHDGRIGLVVGVRPADAIDDWNGRDIIRYAKAVRQVTLDDGTVVTTSGASVIYADILSTIRGDAPVVVAWAAALLLAMILLLVGTGRRAAAVVASTVLGSLAMIAGCALLGLRVTFLDFVALPITLGLGVDYAVNMVDGDGERVSLASAAAILRARGGAVFICSLTTIIGYGSLLVADNQAIRGFGAASLLGEVGCVLTALVVAPAILGLRAPALPDLAIAPDESIG